MKRYTKPISRLEKKIQKAETQAEKDLLRKGLAAKKEAYQNAKESLLVRRPRLDMGHQEIGFLLRKCNATNPYRIPAEEMSKHIQAWRRAHLKNITPWVVHSCHLLTPEGTSQKIFGCQDAIRELQTLVLKGVKVQITFRFENIHTGDMHSIKYMEYDHGIYRWDTGLLLVGESWSTMDPVQNLPEQYRKAVMCQLVPALKPYTLDQWPLKYHIQPKAKRNQK